MSVAPAHRSPVRTVDLVTPEGVPLRFEVAPVGDRLGAFLIDGLLMGVTLMLFWLLILFLGDGRPGGLLQAIGMGTSFLMAFFGFAALEARGRGRTPGKRVMRLRVMDADGGALSLRALVVRNVLRTFEVLLPLTALFSPGSWVTDGPGWAQVLGTIWLLIFGLFPLFNQARLRVGDIVAGTRVVRAPRAMLLDDVTRHKAVAREEAAYRFTPTHLEVYGIYELQVLEDLLRTSKRAGPGHREAMDAVARRIQRKIQWSPRVPPREVDPFLRAFYAALRGHLEGRLLIGRRKHDKHSDEA